MRGSATEDQQLRRAQRPAFASFELSLLEPSSPTGYDCTDRGLSLSVEDQKEVNDKLQQLSCIGDRQSPRPIDNSNLFGNFNVAYTSVLDSTQPRQRKLGLTDQLKQPSVPSLWHAKCTRAQGLLNLAGCSTVSGIVIARLCLMHNRWHLLYSLAACYSLSTLAMSMTIGIEISLMTAWWFVAAAGGRFRNALGRRIFQTRQLCQSVLQPDTVTNKVCPRF